MAKVKGLKGKIIAGRYEIQSLLGSGTFASVWSAKQLQTEGDVAIKILSPGYATDPALVEEFLTEAKRYVRFRDEPHLATVLEVGQDEETGFYYVVMTLLEKTVDGVIQESGPLPVERIYRLAEHVGLALRLIHAAGVVHRDIKGSNILTKGDRFLVSDFGLGLVQEVAERTAPTRDIRQAGTWSYASPEQIKAQKKSDIGQSADFYSLGILLYKAATAKFPFEPSFPQVIHDHLKTPAPDPRALREDLPEPLALIILKLLEKDPKKRHQSADELLAELKDAQTEKAVPTTWAQKVGNRTLATIVGVAVTVLVLFSVLILSSNKGFDVEITSKPPDGTFRIWQGDQGTRFDAMASGPTPGSVEGLKSGRYTVLVEKSGYFSDQRTLDLSRGSHELPVFELEPMHAYRAITDPPGVFVEIARIGENRQKVGEGRAPLTFSGLHAGLHELTYSLDNFRTVVETVMVGTRADTTARRLIGTALVTLEIHTNPTAAEVFIDGKRVSMPTPCRIPNLNSGPRAVRVVVPGHAPFDTTIVLDATPPVQEVMVDIIRHAVHQQRALAQDSGSDRQGSQGSQGSPGSSEPSQGSPAAGGNRPAGGASPEERAATWSASGNQSGGAGGQAGTGRQDEIRHALSLYEQSLESRDVRQYSRLWTTLSGAERRAMEQDFASVQSLQIDLRNLDFQIDGDDATVNFLEVRNRVETSGESRRNERAATMTLHRMGGGEWLISGLDYR